MVDLVPSTNQTFHIPELFLPGGEAGALNDLELLAGEDCRHPPPQRWQGEKAGIDCVFISW